MLRIDNLLTKLIERERNDLLGKHIQSPSIASGHFSCLFSYHLSFARGNSFQCIPVTDHYFELLTRSPCFPRPSPSPLLLISIPSKSFQLPTKWAKWKRQKSSLIDNPSSITERASHNSHSFCPHGSTHLKRHWLSRGSSRLRRRHIHPKAPEEKEEQQSANSGPLCFWNGKWLKHR